MSYLILLTVSLSLNGEVTRGYPHSHGWKMSHKIAAQPTNPHMRVRARAGEGGFCFSGGAA